jgi:hypothetical protein
MSRFVPTPAAALVGGLLACCALLADVTELELLAVESAGWVVAAAFAAEPELSVFEFALTGRVGPLGWA